MGKMILQSIFEFGLLCTPEKLHIYSDLETDDEDKQVRLALGKPEYSHPQSRFCLTLCTEEELFQRKIRGLVAGPEGPHAHGNAWSSHADLFGPFSISFDPLVSRRLGIVPTNYFAPSDVFGHRFAASSRQAPGLNIQMIHRLKELRDLLILLAIVERSITVDNVELPSEEMLRALDLDLPFEKKIVHMAYGLKLQDRKKIFDIFNIDREMALNLVSFTDMMLSLYQETDSTIDGAVLAFYQQREWRLIHHMRPGMIWYCLGNQPEFRNPLAEARRIEIMQLRNNLENLAGQVRTEDYLRQCWVLEEVDGKRISEYIFGVIVPANVVKWARKMTQTAGSSVEVVAAEEFGYRTT